MKSNVQEVFDKVATHLLTQGRKSLMLSTVGESGEQNRCTYRGEGGTSCAVGCLITDEQYAYYALHIEHKNVMDSHVKKALSDSGVLLGDMVLSLLGDLQELHDDFDIDYWLEGLCNVASTHKLDTSVLSKHNLLNKVTKEITT